MKKFISALILVVSFLSACKEDSGPTEFVFIQDPNANGIPIYSEKGYNSFGCLVNESRFEPLNVYIPVKVIRDESTTSFVFDGSLNRNVNASLTFHFLDKVAHNYKELTLWRDQKYDLTSPSVSVYWTEKGKIDTLNITEGEFVFKRVQELIVDNSLEEVILSGTFKIKALKNESTIEFTNGRFDMGVNNYNFFAQ